MVVSIVMLHSCNWEHDLHASHFLLKKGGDIMSACEWNLFPLYCIYMFMISPCDKNKDAF